MAETSEDADVLWGRGGIAKATFTKAGQSGLCLHSTKTFLCHIRGRESEEYICKASSLEGKVI